MPRTGLVSMTAVLERLEMLKTEDPLLSDIEELLYQTREWMTAEQIIESLGLADQVSEMDLRSRMSKYTGAPAPEGIHLAFTMTRRLGKSGFEAYRAVREEAEQRRTHG